MAKKVSANKHVSKFAWILFLVLIPSLIMSSWGAKLDPSPPVYEFEITRDWLTMKDGVWLHSEAGKEVTIIDMQDQGYGILCEGVDSTSTIEGLTLRRSYGAGICCVEFSSLSILDNKIEETQGELSEGRQGAGIYCNSSRPLISGNTINSNRRGILCKWGSFAIISNNIISNNERGIYCNLSPATITHNNIIDNFSKGGIHCTEGSSGEITYNVIVRNQASVGAAIYCSDSSPTIMNNTMVENSGSQSVIYIANSYATVRQNIISRSSSSSVIDCDASATPTILYNDFWDNDGDDGNCVYNGDNVHDDPLFCSELLGLNDPYALDVDSPCAPLNSPCEALIGARPVRCDDDISAERLTWGRVKAMYR